MGIAPETPPTQPRLVARRGEVPVEVVRLGLRPKRIQDLYHSLVRVSWLGLFALLFVAYVVINALFAALYLAGGEAAIQNARPGHYTDAFFFSVQTLATIGYGGMTPNTLYANTLVTVEALVGVLCFALATGLMFAKFARPMARVLFSRVAVVCPRDGKPCLMFRAANERASHIVEAQLKVVVSRNEISREGDSMRRFYDLRLVRHQTTLFSLTWTAMHVIDEHSPLFEATPASLHAQRAEIVVTFTGLDDITLQTVHARHSFLPSEILFDTRFVDIITADATGRRTVNYHRFHDVQAL